MYYIARHIVVKPCAIDVTKESGCPTRNVMNHSYHKSRACSPVNIHFFESAVAHFEHAGDRSARRKSV